MVMVRDVLGEALAAILDRPARLVLNVLGTLVGVTATVATLGLVSTAGAQIVSRFDALAATEVLVTSEKSVDGNNTDNVIPFDAESRLHKLTGVVSAGTLSHLPEVSVRTSTSVDFQAPSSGKITLMAASPGLVDTVHGVLASGRWYDQGHSDRGNAVAVVGHRVAARIGLADLSRQPIIFLDDYPYVVIGVLEQVARQSDLLDAVIIPDGSARQQFGLTAPTSVLIETQQGAAALVAARAALALAPQAPTRLTVVRAPDAEVVRARVATDMQTLFLVLGALSLVVGAIGISNTMLVSVVERTSEIGLRRSLGATRSQVAGQFLTESAMIGTIAGVLGAALGILVIVGVSYGHSWVPVMVPWVPVAAATLGAAVGAIAGAYPAWRAARLQPIAALRAAS